MDPEQTSLKLQHIIRTKQLTTLFQPIVSLGAGTLVGSEALTRGPNGPLYSAKVLFGEASRHRVLEQLDATCFNLAIERFAQEATPDGLLFVNVVPTSLEAGLMTADSVCRVLEGTIVDSTRVVIEVTEGTPVGDMVRFLAVIEEFRRAGFRFALDDLGTGYANFHMLADLNPEFIKLDLGFVQGVRKSSSRAKLIESLQHYALSIGARIVAEGIEVQEDVSILGQLGVELGQGYYFAKPSYTLCG